MIKKLPTYCCAMAQISCSNNDSKESLLAAVNQLKFEADEMDYLGTSTDFGGQTAAFVITTPYEAKLALNLAAIGFRPVFNFARRKGYEKGILTMWVINLS